MNFTSIFEPIVEESPVGIALISGLGKIVYANQVLVNYSGYTKEDFEEMMIDELIISDQEKVFRALTHKKSNHVTIEVQFLKKDQSERWVELHLSSVSHQTLGDQLHVAVFNDITSRKRSEEYFSFHEKILNSLDESLMLIQKQSLSIVYCNATFVKEFGWSQQDVLDVGIEQFLKKLNLRPLKISKILKQLLACDRWKGEIEIKTHDIVRSFDIRFTPYDHPAFGSCWICLANDITLAKKAEESLFRYEKIRSIGLLAGGLAHDFNNLLVGVSANVSLALEEMDVHSSIRNYLEDSLLAIVRAKKLTRQLLIFSKGGQPDKQLVDIPTILEEVIQFNITGTRIIYEIEVAENLLEVHCDSSQIEQVFTNLVFNAKEAMDEKGKISVSIENHQQLSNDADRADFVKIRFSDSGSGIKTADLSKIFDPYFTTKNSGNGLGLSIIHSIIERHGGAISVESEVNQGTTFTILLPASLPSLKAEVAEPRERYVTVPEGLRVLVVDDQSIILNSITRIFSLWKAQVHCAHDGDEVLNSTEIAPNDFDLILLDFTIPGGMGGIETCKRLRELGCTSKIIAMSGYADEGLANIEDWGFDGKLVKPFTLDELAEAISKLH